MRWFSKNIFSVSRSIIFKQIIQHIKAEQLWLKMNKRRSRVHTVSLEVAFWNPGASKMLPRYLCYTEKHMGFWVPCNWVQISAHPLKSCEMGRELLNLSEIQLLVCERLTIGNNITVYDCRMDRMLDKYQFTPAFV